MNTLYVTFDLPQQSKAINEEEKSPRQKLAVIHGARKLSIPGRLMKWEIGEHESSSGKKVYGVKVAYTGERSSEHPEDPGLPQHLQSATQTSEERTEIIEVPAHAENVQIHVDEIPELYRPSLQEAA